MYKALAVLRTIFLLFIVGYTVWTTLLVSYASDVEAVRAAGRAAWFAIGWIALETILGWILATRPRRPPPATMPAPPPPVERPMSPRP